MNTDFRQYAEDLRDIEVATICINQDGEFFVRNERDGRIARVASQRGRLREFLLELCKRLECPEHENAVEPQRAKRKTA